jgi:Zn finger protein HypA/HybF involved in hydrogenase expression
MCVFFYGGEMGISKSLILCSHCGKSWDVPKSNTIFEKQRLESCPCPQCGSYTLAYQEKMIKRLLLEKDDQKIVA